MCSLFPSSRLQSHDPVVSNRTNTAVSVRPTMDTLHLRMLLLLLSMPVGTLMHILSNRALNLLNLRLVMRATHARFMDLLLQRLQSLRQLLDISFARSSLERLSCKCALQPISHTVRARRRARLVCRITADLLAATFVACPRAFRPMCLFSDGV